MSNSCVVYPSTDCNTACLMSVMTPYILSSNKISKEIDTLFDCGKVEMSRSSRGAAMQESKENLLKLVNTSGFPFQMALSNLIMNTINEHEWRVFSSGVPWNNPKTLNTGYIDLILKHKDDVQFMVIEYKIAKDSE